MKILINTKGKVIEVEKIFIKMGGKIINVNRYMSIDEILTQMKMIK